MVRYANTSKTVVSVLDGSTSYAIHHFRGGSLYAPYGLLSLLALRHVTINAINTASIASKIYEITTV